MSPKSLLILLFLFPSLSFAQFTDAIDFPVSSWKFSEAGKNEWKTADVPGNIHRDLLSNKLIADPTIKDNVKKCRWVEDRKWEYITQVIWDSTSSSFHLKSDHAELVFDCLDTYADVLLNDSLLLHADNMFRTYRIPVETRLHKGKNTLRVVFHPPVETARMAMRNTHLTYPADKDSTSPFTRKSAVEYGWDFAPRLLTCGIRKRVHLCMWNDFRISDLHLVLHALSPASAFLIAEVSIESAVTDSVTLFLQYAHQSKRVFLKEGRNFFRIPFTVTNPVLWWPAGMGEARLYEEQVIAYNKRSRSSFIQSYGIRKLEWVSKEDSIGKSFFLKVNDIPVFIKGTNLVPSPLLSKTANSHAELMASVLDCGMNMVRIWGGGSYGDDAFFQAADQNGILVWEDFMFAGTLYPGDSAFLHNVAKEAEDNITRLRNHPSLALWCGNNEIEVAWKNWGWQKQFLYTPADTAKLMKDYNKLFNQLLPKKVQELDSGRFYFPSSPMSNWGKTEDLKKGDNHYWGVWHGDQPLEAYNTHVARFVSEFGFESFPEQSSLAKCCGEGELNTGNECLGEHQFSKKGTEKISRYMEMYYRKPKDFASFVYLSQLLQAEAMKTGIEAQRRARPFCMGSLFWQFNDYWPAVSWSAVDYYGAEKAAFFFIKKAYQPLMISTTLERTHILVWGASDALKPIKAQLYLRYTDLKGGNKTEIFKAITLPPNASGKIPNQALTENNVRIFASGILTPGMEGYSAENCVVYCSVSIGKDTLAENISYFVAPKDLELSKPFVIYTLKIEDDHYLLKLRSDVLAKNVFIHAGTNTVYPDDNFFDLLPGREKTIRLYSDQGLEKLKKELVITSLWDSFTE